MTSSKPVETRKPILWLRVKGRGYRQLYECDTVEEAERELAVLHLAGKDVLWSYERPKILV